MAILKWAPYSGLSFGVGINPSGVAFDGTNIWVANFGGGGPGPSYVSKLRASDGASQGLINVGRGNPSSVAFDGANIWVANIRSGNVKKLRASDGATLGTFPVGSNPVGVAFDGANIWVANSDSNNVTKLRASDGAQPRHLHRGQQLRPAWPSTAPTSGWRTTAATASPSCGPATARTWAPSPWDAARRRGLRRRQHLGGKQRQQQRDQAAGQRWRLPGHLPRRERSLGVAFDGANIWVANCRQQQRHQAAGQRRRAWGPSPWAAVPSAWPSTAPTSG